MYFGSALDRKDFLAWLGGGLTPTLHPTDVGEFPTSLRASVLLMWDGRPARGDVSDVPPLIVIEGDLGEFYAFVATYVSTYQPFSAFFRVVTVEQIAQILRSERPEPSSVLRGPVVGAVVAEAYVQVGQRAQTLAEISVQACRATVSMPLANALMLGLSSASLEQIVRNWLESRRDLSQSEELRLKASDSYDFWRVIFDVFDRTKLKRVSPLVRFVREHMQSAGEFVPDTWRELVSNNDELMQAALDMSSSREDRVRLLDKLVPLIRSSEIDVTVGDALIGYLAARVAAGSFAYLSLLDEIKHSRPVASLWYGLFCGSMRDSDVMVAGDCLGRRLDRHLGQLEPLFSQPSSDISHAELKTLSTEGATRFRTEQSSTVVVEVFPTIMAAFRSNRERRKGEEHRDGVNRDAIREARALSYRISVLLSQAGDIVQTDMFDERKVAPYGRPSAKTAKRTQR